MRSTEKKDERNMGLPDYVDVPKLAYSFKYVILPLVLGGFIFGSVTTAVMFLIFR